MGGRHEAATAAQAIRAFVLKAAGAAYKVNIYLSPVQGTWVSKPKTPGGGR